MSAKRWRPARRPRIAASPPANPFATLGLEPADLSLTDEDVRAGWRRLADATHPDRPDGGDPALFAAAAAAYTDLRTPAGRGEARAALASSGAGSTIGLARRTAQAGPDMCASILARVRSGRPVRIALRAALAGGAAAAAVLSAGPGPAGPALATGVATWLVLTIRADLGPRA